MIKEQRRFTAALAVAGMLLVLSGCASNPTDPNDPLAILEAAFVQCAKTEELELKVKKMKKKGEVTAKGRFNVIEEALEKGLITSEERDDLVKTTELRDKVVAVDYFKPGELKI